MSTELARAGTAALESYIAAGDIGRLNPEQRIALYRGVCDSLGLNPLTQPFQYLVLNGKTVLYATKSCTEQLRQIHGVSVMDLSIETRGDILCMTATVRSKDGREDRATGAVNLKGLAGDALANAWMKCETKAKRRATLSVCGLAVLDESEVDSIQGAVREEARISSAPESAPAAALPEREHRRIDAPLPSEVEIGDGCTISPVTNKAGKKIWKLETPSGVLAVIDQTLAAGIEASIALGAPIVATVEERGGKRIVSRIEEAVDA